MKSKDRYITSYDSLYLRDKMKTLNEILDERLILESILSEGQEQHQIWLIFLKNLNQFILNYSKSWQSVYFVDPNLRILKIQFYLEVH